jgi:hypothetical protein
MTTSPTNRERRLRRAVARTGHRLRKERGTDRWNIVNGDGAIITLADDYDNEFRADFLTLDEVERWFEEPAA